MALEGKLVKSRRKAQFSNQRTVGFAPKKLAFAHQMNVGETDINLTALVAPAGMNGFTSSSTPDLLAAHIYAYPNNISLKRSDGGALIQGMEYKIISDKVIRLITPALAGTVIYGTIDTTPTTGNVAVDGFQIVATGTLTIGQTDITSGMPFQLFANPSQQIGAVLVFRNGRLMSRNDGNATAGLTAPGNYQELPTGVGLCNSIRFNRPGILLQDGSNESYMVLSNGIVALAPSAQVFSVLDTLGGQMDKVIQVLAAVSGNPSSFFQANPNQIDLRTFGDRVIALENKSMFVGSAYIHTAASHTNTAGATLAPVNTAGGGTPFIEFNPGPGTFSVASVNTPRIGVNNLLPGTYRVTMSVTGDAGSANASLAINDGITTSGYAGFDGTQNKKTICIGYFKYTAPSTSVVYELWAANDTNTTTVYADGAPGVGAGHAWDAHISIEKVG